MRTGHLIGLLGAGTLVCLFACSSSDSGGTGGGTAKGGSAGSVNKDGGTGGSATGGGGGTAGASGCGFTMKSSTACDNCDKTKCGSQCAACTASTDCTDFVTCIQACTTDACITDCQTKHSAGSTIMTTWDSCLSSSCATDCPNCNLTTNDTTCDGCFQSKCVTQCAACTAECLAVIQCVGKCTSGDTPCEDACATAHPTGVDPANAFASCMQQQCTTECGGSADGG